ncbi:DUF6191 domain-containing protein [Streptomyces tsukubensis]|uniref:Uncharacterized protein n=1 Tax=Streptomyces tsukubensis (strain DSM 42081 / NBRC 108919 / NRRL 18488 / 9993) TaxID=1114943 RepID=A0A7G3UA86_STRT9|nr:DUF6191 domain-containing protein [Streptomyces tsukubensis]AZK96681.1 hypothetical protein B7R87_24540 [Streptomyces tsukubensis]QKM67323.1 hypothetical protein STSU_009220 [Streptomyces tsukubensis NRRL18488]TAI42026.1 hypothetical protein EWI31_24080 [Streptomyces tsukubensis]
MLNILDQIFAPGRKHTDDEQKRLELTRVDVGAADPARGPIDLASGRVTVRLPGTASDGAAPAAAEPGSPGSPRPDGQRPPSPR